MYKAGKGVQKDYSEAIKWYSKAAKQGNPAAQNNLGYMYDTGLGVQKDYSEAIKWYTKAEKQGDSTAQNNLGSMYSAGTGVKKDYSEAIKWYSKAAKQGNSAAQKNLEGLARYGLTKEYIEKLKAARKGVVQGKKGAISNLNKIADINFIALFFQRAAFSSKEVGEFSLSVGETSATGWKLEAIMPKLRQVKMLGPDGQVYYLNMSITISNLQITKDMPSFGHWK